MVKNEEDVGKEKRVTRRLERGGKLDGRNWKLRRKKEGGQRERI